MDEQRWNIKFSLKPGESATESYNLIQHVYSGEALSCTCVFEWHKLFREGWETTDDNARSGCPSTMHTPENIE